MNRICAGIVLYQPNYDRLKANIEAILPQVEHLYLVDNASENLDAIRQAYASDEKISLLCNPENYGIAKALNQMCEAAEDDEYDWIVTLDQDSVCYDDMVQAFVPYLNENGVAILAPKVIDDYEIGVLHSDADPVTQDISRCNTSGSLTNLFIWRKIGGFDERMFIDCVDFDYCTNAIVNGYRVVRVFAAKIHHRLGRAIPIRAFIPLGKLLHIDKWCKTIFTYDHSPERTYYYARNIRYYQYKYRGKIDRRQERITYFRWWFLKLVFEKKRFGKLCAILRGRRDSKKLIREYRQQEKQKEKGS